MGLIEKIKKQGWIYSFAILFNRIVPAWLFRCRRFVVLQLDETRSNPAPANVEVSWCQTESEYTTVEELTYFRRANSEADFVACQAKRDGKVAGGFWAASKWFDENGIGVRIELEPQQVWLFAAVVEKQFRGQGVHSAVLEFIIPGLASKGFKEIFLSVNPDNLGSYHVHKKRSKQILGTVYSFRLFSIAICWSRGSVKCDRFMTFEASSNPIRLRLNSD